MEFLDFKNALIEEVKLNLPGEDAHLNMTPLGRKKSSEAKQESTYIRASAVAIIIYKKENHWHTIVQSVPQMKHSALFLFTFYKPAMGNKTPDDMVEEEEGEKI